MSPRLSLLLAHAVVLFHLGFVLFVLFGGLPVVHWPRLAWVHLPAGARVYVAYYEREEVWSSESLQRRVALLPKIEAYQAALRGDA